MERPKTQNSQHVIKGKFIIGELRLSNLETDYKVAIIKEHGINGRID